MCESSEVLGLMRSLKSLQEERVHTYRLFEEGHKIYLCSAPNYEFTQFRSLVNDVTQEFKRISNSIIGIESKLRNEYECLQLADLIRKLQEREKTKLELTAKLQLAKQEMLENPDQDIKVSLMKQLKERLGYVVQDINDILEEVQEICVDEFGA